VFVAVTAVLLALGHAHLASKMATAANISRDPAASAMMLNLRGALSGSALVLFSLALLLIVGCQQIQRSIGQKER